MVVRVRVGACVRVHDTWMEMKAKRGINQAQQRQSRLLVGGSSTGRQQACLGFSDTQHRAKANRLALLKPPLNS